MGFLEAWSLGKPWIVIQRQLPTGDGLFEFRLLISHTARSRKPLLALGYPGLDIFWRVQGQGGSLDDNGLPDNRLELVAMKGGINCGM